ncbi:SDR family NAD(P)-dependent oxidoreductase [Streptomyces sp. NL15-2K]|uniref:SDR family NAD(P)-dependent oxidoreductase n=1 Tax=Streptomyces sp. NL15-2K TaxID=376149 RepID=UPI000F56221D|nr:MULTISPECIES: SDR family NAD(P)-dependent oxidoreductase [Actinomycetes]WKX07082.1 SDR family NAD(P)-dependent oxidoreductase [Kutzneria buriramensis]
MSDVANRRSAVITGAAQGLGAEIAFRLAGEGYAIALLDLRKEGLEHTGEKIASRFAGTTVKTIPVDLSSEELVADAFGEIDAELGRVDVLVNTAGGSGTEQVRDIADLSSRTWHTVLDNNVTSAFLCCRYAVPIMRRNGYGRIVNFSSAVSRGLSGPSGTVGARLAYATSKAAVNGFTRQLAKDLARSGITVNAVSPGLVLPEEGRVRRVFDALPDTDQAAIRAAIPAGRTGTAHEIASAVAYLVSEDAGFTSGTILSVDGAAS